MAAPLPGSPMIRASFLRDNVKALSRLGAVDEAAILRRVPSVAAATDMSLKTEWLDLGLDVSLSEATDAEVGGARLKQLNRDLMAALVAGPIIHPLHATALRLLGPSPEKLFKWVPKGWSGIFRNVGSPTWDAHDRALRFSRMPRAAMSLPWLEGVGAALEGLVELFGGKSAGSELSHDVETGVVVYALHWR